MPKIEQHGREKHNMTIDDQTRNKVRNANQDWLLFSYE